jgi:site-specific recombinase XerD
MPNEPKRLDADLLTRADAERLIGTCSKRAPTGQRNAAMLAVAWRCGLRAGELVALAVKDVDLKEGRLVVQRGKGGRRRIVGLDAGTAALIERWLETRPKRGITPRAPLFCTLHGTTLCTSYLRHLVRRLAKRARVAGRVHPHALRHRFAADLIAEGAPLTTVRDLLGHSSIATTSIYLSRIGASEAVEFARSRQWGMR